MNILIDLYADILSDIEFLLFLFAGAIALWCAMFTFDMVPSSGWRRWLVTLLSFFVYAGVLGLAIFLMEPLVGTGGLILVMTSITSAPIAFINLGTYSYVSARNADINRWQFFGYFFAAVLLVLVGFAVIDP